MGLKSFLIGPLQEGQQNNIEPFYLPEEAYFELQDLYVWRGRVRKRIGSSLIGADDLTSRLRINLGNTDGSGNISLTVPGAIFKVGQMFSIGSELFTVNVVGTPADLLDTGAATLATYNTTTGALVITGAAATTPCFFYPAEPVMGLRSRESGVVNEEEIIGFDTQFAYQRSGGAWARLGTALWTGNDSQFFWSTNYRGTNPYETFFYTVNYVPTDNIKFIPAGSSTWTNFRPQLNTGGTNRFLETCLILLPFKDRLVALNTIEDEGGTDRTYVNRCRFSQNGDPTNATTSWIDDTAGRGGFIDAPTAEQIVTAEPLKDRLIVYFERSTWELVYTGDRALPFRWQQLNNELGCEGTFSVIGFDQTVLGVGNVGVHSCNGVNVNRIDEKIPDEVFQIHNGNDGPARVYGIRDYFNELVYWSFPDASDDPTYPTRMLLYNYRNNTWAFFTDSFTCFGYFQKDTDLKWETVEDRYPTWSQWNEPWGSPLFQSSHLNVISGNQEGFVFLLDSGLSSNAQSLSITDMTPSSTLTIIAHNLPLASYILIQEAQGITSLNGTIVQVQEVVDENTIVIDTEFSGTYLGGGKVSRVSNLKILTKQFNPGTPVGEQFRVPYIDFLLNRTSEGEVSLNYLIDTSSGDAIQDQVSEGVLFGNNILFTKVEDTDGFQINQQQIWHRYYVETESQFLQLLFFMSDSQMRNREIAQSDFELHAMLFYAEPEGRIIG